MNGGNYVLCGVWPPRWQWRKEWRFEGKHTSTEWSFGVLTLVWFPAIQPVEFMSADEIREVLDKDTR